MVKALRSCLEAAKGKIKAAHLILRKSPREQLQDLLQPQIYPVYPFDMPDLQPASSGNKATLALSRSGRGSCSPESSCCDLDIPPTTGSEAVRRVGILMGGPGSGRPKSRHRTVESCLAQATVDSGYTWQDQTMIRERIQQ